MKDVTVNTVGCCYIHMNESELIYGCACAVCICDLSMCLWRRMQIYFFSSWLTLFLCFPPHFFICSVQKLSEFFSSDEIGDEQEPRAMVTSGSSNHNQNRYQAVVSLYINTCALIHFLLLCLVSYVCWSLTRLLVHPGCLSLLLCTLSSSTQTSVLSISLLNPFVSSVLDVTQPSSSHPLNLSLRHPPPLCPGTCSPWRWWTGSAPRGMTGTTTAHRGTMRATDPPMKWTKTYASRWGREKRRNRLRKQVNVWL